jgi:hypothetical protein
MFRSLDAGAAALHFVIGAAAAGAALVWPLTAALAPADARATRIVSALLAVAACTAIAFLTGRGRRTAWTMAAGAAALGALLLLPQHIGASASCIADYDGEPRIIGREFTPEGEQFVAANPRGSVSDLLLDAGGQSEVVWTARSISRCHLWVSWGGLLVVPWLAICLSSLVAGRAAGRRWWPSPASTGAAGRQSLAAAAVRYDAFMSYRRLDRERAEGLVEELESRGFRVAIDFRDFRPNEQVLTEMERCIRESRFLLCVITAQYVASGFTIEEANIARLLDLTERRNRIVPLIFDRVPLPVWWQGLVGIDFGANAQGDPLERLVTLLSSARETSGDHGR